MKKIKEIKEIKRILIAAAASLLLLSGCGSNGMQKENSDNASLSVKENTEKEAGDNSDGEKKAELADGIYTAEFTTDSGMFHVSEACDGKGTLTVENGEMTIHISLGSKNIVNLYPGLAKDAQEEGAVLLEPTEDTVTYSDGISEEVYGFDVPVPALETEFDLALIGTKGVWYDHKVSVSNPTPAKDQKEESPEESQKTKTIDVKDGEYTIELTMEGGSGKAQILSPAQIRAEDGKITARVEWNSPNYDYMLADGEKYLPVNTEGNSVFEIPVTALDEELKVIGDTIAMSKPHEVEYTLTFHSDTLQAAE